ncbi:Parvovirus coat protein VP1-like protein [Bacillus sp. AK128]
MPCFPGYRYCGPGCSGPGAPVNRLDAICREHDLCYQRTGSRRICDDIFLNRIRPLTDQRSQMARDARVMYRLMNLNRSF